MFFIPFPVLYFLFSLSCAPTPPPVDPNSPPPPPPLKISHVLDSKSFAFDVAFLSEKMVGCALMEDGVYRLAIYDHKTGDRLRHVHLGPGQDWLHALAVAPGGDLLAVGFRSLRQERSRLVAGGSVALYHLPTGRRVQQISLPTPVRTVAFVDREVLVLGTEARYLRIGRRGREPKPGTALVCRLHMSRGLQGCVADHTDTVTSVVPLPDGGVASGSWDRTVRLRDRWLQARGDPLSTAAPVNALAVGPQKVGARAPGLAVATSQEPPRRSRSTVDRKQQDRHRKEHAAGDAVELWDLASRRRLRVLRPHRAPVTEVALAPGAGALATGSWDWSVTLTRGQHSAQLRPFSQIVTGLAFHPSARTLAVAAWSEHRSGAPSCLLVRY